MLNDNNSMNHDQLMRLANDAVRDFKQANEIKKAQLAANPPPNPNQFIQNVNYRTIPCRNYHGPTGCTRGDFCHFIHAE